MLPDRLFLFLQQIIIRQFNSSQKIILFYSASLEWGRGRISERSLQGPHKSKIRFAYWLIKKILSHIRVLGTRLDINVQRQSRGISSTLFYSEILYSSTVFTWSDNKVRELIAVKVLHISLLNTTAVAFEVLPFRIYAQVPAPSPPFKKILELVLWNGLQSCCCITPDVIKMPSFQYFLYLREQKKVTGGQIRRIGRVSNTVICLVAKNSPTDSAV